MRYAFLEGLQNKLIQLMAAMISMKWDVRISHQTKPRAGQTCYRLALRYGQWGGPSAYVAHAGKTTEIRNILLHTNRYYIGRQNLTHLLFLEVVQETVVFEFGPALPPSLAKLSHFQSVNLPGAESRVT